MTWLRERGFELIEVPADDAFQLGGNAISLATSACCRSRSGRPERAAARPRADRLRARPVDVHPGGRRRPLPCAGASPPARRGRMSAEPAIDAARVIADLRELDRRTGGADGAQRICWGAGWRQARSLLGELLGEIGLEAQPDPAGNLWASLEGDAGAGAGAWLPSRLGAGGWLARRRARRDGGARRAPGMGWRRGPPAPDAGAGGLGRRGGRALRPQPARQLRVLGNPRTGRAARPARRGWRRARRRAGRERRRPGSGAAGGQPPEAAGRLSRAPHRAGALCSKPRACGRPRSAAAPASSATASASAVRHRMRERPPWTAGETPASPPPRWRCGWRRSETAMPGSRRRAR